MDTRLTKVHISYKHDTAHEDAVESIKNGLSKNGISFSIDEYDIMYRDSIDDYEKEIGLSERVIMFVIPSYFKSLDCMYEMTRIFKAGNVNNRVYPVVDMGEIARNGDGLRLVKDFWQNELMRKSKQLVSDPGRSKYLLGELQKIDEIKSNLDDLWDFLCRRFTGTYEKLIEDDAEMLVQEILKGIHTDGEIAEKVNSPSGKLESSTRNIVNQYGSNSVYIENNNGSIKFL